MGFLTLRLGEHDAIAEGLGVELDRQPFAVVVRKCSAEEQQPTDTDRLQRQGTPRRKESDLVNMSPFVVKPHSGA